MGYTSSFVHTDMVELRARSILPFCGRKVLALALSAIIFFGRAPWNINELSPWFHMPMKHVEARLCMANDRQIQQGKFIKSNCWTSLQVSRVLQQRCASVLDRSHTFLRMLSLNWGLTTYCMVRPWTGHFAFDIACMHRSIEVPF